MIKARAGTRTLRGLQNAERRALNTDSETPQSRLHAAGVQDSNQKKKETTENNKLINARFLEEVAGKISTYKTQSFSSDKVSYDPRNDIILF